MNDKEYSRYRARNKQKPTTWADVAVVLCGCIAVYLTAGLFWINLQ